MSTVSMVTPLPDPEPGVTHPQSSGRGLPNSAQGSHIQSLLCKPPPDHAPEFTSPQSPGWRPSQTLNLGSYVHSLHCDTPCHNLHLGSHVHSPPSTVLPRFVHRVTCPHSPSDPTSLPLYCGTTTTMIKPHRPGTWVLRSTVSMVNHSQTLHLR